jgi:predicted ATP-grasp superfamily ATP-dependent carboligase
LSVLVSDGNQRSTLAVVRSLGKAGIPVTVGESANASLAGSSRYCRRRLHYPSPEVDAEGFLACLRQELSGRDYKFLLPMTDVAMQVVSAARESLAPFVALPFPDSSRVRQVQDKGEVMRLARSVGIECPKTFMVDEGLSLDEIARTVSYPVVIKPRFSRFLKDERWAVGTVQYANDPAVLIAQYHRSNDLIPRPMIQERIQGEGRGVFLLLWKGELKAAFCHRRLREKPPWGGVSVYCESIPADQGLIEQSAALLQAIGWQGVAMVEYKVDPRDGQAKLMEVNGRFWGSLQLAIDAGIDFPLMLYRLALGDEVAPKFDYRAGVKSRWLLGDLDHLFIRLFRHGPPGVRPANEKSKLRSMLNFMKFYEPNLQYEVQRMDDFSPAWFEFRKYVLGHF